MIDEDEDDVHTHPQLDDSPIVRRQIIKAVKSGKIAAQDVLHIAHYKQSAQLYINEAKRLERPLDVLNIGAGDMWDLHILNGGTYVRKADIIKSYTAVDIIELVSPFGSKLSEDIKFKSVKMDLMDGDYLPADDHSIDVVIACEIIEHVDFQTAKDVMIDAFDVLRPGGVMLITTPNATNNSRSDKYHIDEWELDKLLEFLEPYFNIVAVYGTYIDRRKFTKANKEHKRVPEDLLTLMENRFDTDFQRVILATFYPEYANGIGVVLRKPENG